ncbi:hypothetical protein HDU82_005824 [Entophlyctis luteolus]|nr:hypothetical protein HDU82_005824 [Entophlyctis luteolus]KAJ3393994.1 hypothetical protein HDU84_000493 [Entophlyctis sp. JEL0112]
MSRSLALAVAAVSASAAAMALARGRCTRLGSWRGVVHCDDGRQPQSVPNSAAKQRQLASFSSPSFQGTPVAATLLMHQASRPFEEHFRDVLEMSPVFVLPDALPDADSYAKNYAQRQQEQSEKETTVDGSELSSNEFGYVETGAFMGSWATGVEVKVPVFEKLSANEDARYDIDR